MEKAIAAYEQMIYFDAGKADRRLIRPRYHYRLAKLYEETGQKKKALESYQHFLEIWKDADSHIPELVEAKKRFAKLTGIK